MAKKRRKEEKKEVFKRPEFDEIEFMQKEIATTKVAVITILFALPIAVVSFGITLVGLPAAGFLIGIGSVFLLKYVLEFFNVDTKQFEWKDKLGNGAMFFFTWLAVWVLILNVPFTDLTNPNIGSITIVGCSDPATLKLKSDIQNVCEIDSTSTILTIESKITDNSDVRSVTIHITSPTSITTDMNGLPSDKYAYYLTLTEGETLDFFIVAEDVNGHTETSSPYVVIVS